MESYAALQQATLFWRENFLRGLLSVAGVMIGIVGLVIAAAIDRGAEAELAAVASRSGTGLVQVHAHGNLPADVVTQLHAALGVRVRGISAYQEQSASITYRRNSNLSRVKVTDPDYAATTRMQFADGRFIAPLDVQHRRQVIVLNEVLAAELLPYGKKLDNHVLINQRWHQVIGVAADGLGTPMAYLPLSPGLRRNLMIAFTSETVMRESLEDLQRSLAVRLTGSSPSVDIVIPIDAIREQQQVRRLVRNVLVVCALLVLGLGGLGVANLMLLNVLTRAAEIALRRALGARARDIVLQFAMETLVICVIGGAVALLFSPIVAFVLKTLLDWPLELDWSIILQAMFATAAVAAAASVMPARSAVHVPPAQGLA